MDSVSSYCCGHPLPSEPSVRGPLCPSRGFCVQIRGDVALQWLLCPDTRRRSAAVGAGGFSGFLKFRSQLETLEITPARRYYRSRASLQAPRRTMTPSFRFSIPGTQLQLCLCKSERQSRNFFFLQWSASPEQGVEPLAYGHVHGQVNASISSSQPRAGSCIHQI